VRAEGKVSLRIEHLEQLLSEHQEKLRQLRQSARESNDDGKRKSLEEVAVLCDQLMQHLQEEIEVAKHRSAMAEPRE
jgi:hypothetical protein